MHNTQKLSLTIGALSLLLAGALTVTNTGVQAKKDKGGGGVGVTCTPDMVNVGKVFCMDKYVNSVWTAPAAQIDALRTMAESDTATIADLAAIGATQLGVTANDYPCNTDERGGGCKDKIFALSLANVLPSRFVSWYTALQACANSAKNLISDDEWKMAAAGAPQTSQCVYLETDPVKPAGSANCVSDWGVVDMVGDSQEWIGEIIGDDDSGGTYLPSLHDRAIGIGHNFQKENLGFRCKR